MEMTEVNGNSAPKVVEQRKMPTYENIIQASIGPFGWAQALIIIITGLPQLVAAWTMIFLGYAGNEPDWWLQLPNNNLTTANSSDALRLFKTCPNESLSGEIIFADTYSIVSEWGLICEKSWVVTTIQTVQMVGVMVGAAVGGSLGDLIGRRKTLLIVFTMDLLFCLVEGLSVNWYMMAVAAFFVGVALGGFLVLITVSLLEFVATDYRTVSSAIPFWGFGVAVFGLLFKVLPYWRHLCYATSACGLAVLILMWFFLPESVRWLFTQNRIEEGDQVLTKLALRNKRPKPELGDLKSVLNSENSSRGKKYSYLSLFKFKQTRFMAPLFGFVWFSVTFIYYGITLGVSRLSGDMTLNQLFMGIGEIFVFAIVWSFAKCFGRRNSSVILLLLTSATSLAITVAYFTASEQFILSMNVLALVSRTFLSAAWSSLMLQTSESFPTVVRTTVYGFASVWGRIGGILAPQNKTLSEISAHLPFTVNGVLAFLCAMFCLLLKDTYSTDLEDYFKEDEKHEDFVGVNSPGKEIV